MIRDPPGLDTMGWQLPSLAALRTFEAAARHLSFTKAAAELNLTQSAVSRHIRGMEEYLGVLLFERIKQRLVLTEAGRSYVEEIRSSLARMQDATINLVAHRGKGGILTVATPPAFCVKWLIPRLNDFRKAHPDILINLLTRAKPFNFEIEKVDAAIHYGSDDWPGVSSDPLIGEEIVVVCSPAYLAKHSIVSPQDLNGHTLLQSTRRPDTWREWLEAKSADNVNAYAGLRFDAFYLIIQAAIAGLGVALLPRLLIADELENGLLAIALDEPFKSRNAYCLVYPEAKRADPRLQAFRQWLLDQAETALVPTLRKP